jgi:RNA polymerase sigma-70 factor (ECF subfamily)
LQSGFVPMAGMVRLMNANLLEHALADRSMLVERADEQLRIQDIIRRHHDGLIKFLRRRLSVADDADDVAQETYIRMMKYEGSREIRSPSAMLFRIAVNVANDHGRSAVARCAARHTDIDNVDLISDHPSAEREVLAGQNLDLLLEVIENLPPKCKQVFLLSRAGGMTYPEIAQHCGISVKMVEKQISRAMAACLKKVGGEDEITS